MQSSQSQPATIEELAGWRIALGGLTVGWLCETVSLHTILAAAQRNAHYRGFAAALAGDAASAVQETRNIWQQKGIVTFLKAPVFLLLPVAIRDATHVLAVHALTSQVPVLNQKPFSLLRLSRDVFANVVAGVASYPAQALVRSSLLGTLPSWKDGLVNRVLLGRHYFYAALPVKLAYDIIQQQVDKLRAFALHWHKTTFFPDFLPHADDASTALTGRRVAYFASTALAHLVSTSVVVSLLYPLENVMVRMIGMPDVYGPLGVFGTIKSIWANEGVWGFLHGVVPGTLAWASTVLEQIAREADEGPIDPFIQPSSSA